MKSEKTSFTEKLAKKKKYAYIALSIALLLLISLLFITNNVSRHEKKIYEYSSSLYKGYQQQAFELNDANQNEDVKVKSDRLVDAEKRSIKETAQKYNITEKEVIRIVSEQQ